MLGRAFCLAAMIKCGKGTETEHLVILVELFKILKSKDYLRQDRIHGFLPARNSSAGKIDTVRNSGIMNISKAHCRYDN